MHHVHTNFWRHFTDIAKAIQSVLQMNIKQTCCIYMRQITIRTDFSVCVLCRKLNSQLTCALDTDIRPQSRCLAIPHALACELVAAVTHVSGHGPQRRVVVEHFPIVDLGWRTAVNCCTHKVMND
jgi:hypothetical protein